jgi:hypothetical protein
MNLWDEPDFEVTDLRTGGPDERIYTHIGERRQRRRQMGAVVTSLVLVFALVIAFMAVPGFGASVRQALHLATPSPAPAFALGGDIVYFEHGLPWGTLLLDGKVVTNVDTEQPYTGFEQLYTSLHIPRGRHLLEYRASPFPALRCWISTPQVRTDTCPLVLGRGNEDVTPPFGAERVLNLHGDPAHLSLALQSSLEATAAATIGQLAAATTLVPGDSYADANGAPQVATAQMSARLNYHLATDPGNEYHIPGSSYTCAILCAIQPASYVNDDRAQWVVAAHVLPRWTYSADSGAPIDGSASPQGIAADSIIPLSVTWDGAWHVKITDSLATSPICFIALNLFAALHLAGAPLSSLQLFAAPMPADGCVAEGMAVDATGAPRVPFAVIYRFGLLFASGDEARRLLPAMRVADAHLQALARAWAGL